MFIAYYRLTLHSVDVTTDNPLLAPVLFVERISARLTNQIANNAVEWTLVFGLAVAVIAGFEIRRVGASSTVACPPKRALDLKATLRFSVGE